MKTLSFLTSLLIIASLMACSKSHGDLSRAQVPKAVKTAFQKEYSSVKGEEWEKEGAFYEAEWEENDMDKAAYYNESGVKMGVETQIATDQLPGEAIQYIADHYAGYKITEAAKKEMTSGTTYEAELRGNGEELDVVFDANGNFVEEEMDMDHDDNGNHDDDDDDDDDDD